MAERKGAARRVSDEPAYVLHRYDWSESSLILEVFTRHHGRLALVAKGAKRPTSSFRPVLLPLQPLRLAYGGEAEVRALKSAEWQGGHVMPTGSALLAGYYLNELLLKLLARDDPHPALFDVYAEVVRLLASASEDLLQVALRGFELQLLRELGVLPALNQETATLAVLEPAAPYHLVAEGGLRLGHADERGAIAGAQWQALHRGLQERDLAALLRACAPLQAELKPMLRKLLHYHCGVDLLRTRRLMLELQGL